MVPSEFQLAACAITLGQPNSYFFTWRKRMKKPTKILMCDEGSYEERDGHTLTSPHGPNQNKVFHGTSLGMQGHWWNVIMENLLCFDLYWQIRRFCCVIISWFCQGILMLTSVAALDLQEDKIRRLQTHTYDNDFQAPCQPSSWRNIYRWVKWIHVPFHMWQNNWTGAPSCACSSFQPPFPYTRP